MRHAPAITVVHGAYLTNRRYRREVHAALRKNIRTFGQPGLHVHALCLRDESCCRLEARAITYVRIVRALQADGVKVHLVDPQDHVCEHNLEDAG